MELNLMKSTLFSLAGAAFATISAFFGGWDASIKTLVALMLADFLTGLAVALFWHKSPKTADGAASSKESLRGILRKTGMLVVVIVAGMDGSTSKERLGNVCVIRYNDVRRNDGTVGDLICRMYHFDRVDVKAGDKVKGGDVIGLYGNTGYHTTGAHLHIEFDTDVQHPLHAFGVSSGGKIILGGTVNSSVNPDKVWYAGEGQTLKGASSSDWYTADQAAAPRLPTEQNLSPTEAQKLAHHWEEKYSSLLQRVKDVAQAG